MKLFEAESRLRSINWVIKHIKDDVVLCGEVCGDDSSYITSLLDSLLSEKSRLSFLIDEAKSKNFFDKTSTIKQAEFYKKDIEDRIDINNFLMSKFGLDRSSKAINFSDYVKKTIELRNVSSKIEEQLLLLSTMVDIDTT